MATNKFDSFVFTHIPKCGGTSFRAYINDCARNSGISKEEIYIPGYNNLSNDKNISQLNDEELKILRKKNIKVFAGHTKHNDFEKYSIPLERPFKFTILRNPVDRFISHYNYFNYTLGYNDCKGIALNQLTIENRKYLLQRHSNLQTTYLSDVKHPRITGPSNLLKIAKYNIQHEYQVVGILEKIDACLNDLKTKGPSWLNFKNELPKFNIGIQSNNLHTDIIEEIKEANSLDCLLYEFANELFI